MSPLRFLIIFSISAMVARTHCLLYISFSLPIISI
jgi:hypothetical protein